MSEQTFNTRIILKHDIEAHWDLATGFIPKKGEIVIYDTDKSHAYNRIKIGDGMKPVSVNQDSYHTDALPFYSTNEAIIDVTSLPTENINENAFYRLLTGTLVVNQNAQNGWTCYCVESLPETGEPVTLDMISVTAYYNIADGDVYGYINDMLAAQAGVPVGWYPLSTLAPLFGVAWGGVITDIMDDPADDTCRLLLEGVVYHYKDGWVSMKIIGASGTGGNAEVFNHPSNKATGTASHAEGQGTHAEGNSSHAEGNHSHAEGIGSHAEGDNSHAKGTASHAEGENSHAEGQSSHAEGSCSHAEGSYSHAEGSCSHAKGYSSHAEGIGSHAEGIGSHAEGSYSHAEGSCSHAKGYSSHAEGNDSHAEGSYSHAEGENSHAEGYGYYININITGGANATIYTVNTTLNLIIGASIRYTVVEDNVPTYYTAKITAIDNDNLTVTVNRTLSVEAALNNQSVIVYVAGMALGDNSHSEGNQTIAAGRSQHTQGEFNVVDPEYDVNNNNNKRGKYAHIVGNGTSHIDRSNAHTLDWNGNGWFAGDVYVGSTSGTNQDDGSEKLAKLSDIPTPDWNAAEGEAGHILNRTHHSVVTEVTDIVPDVSVDGADYNSATGGYRPKVLNIPIAGETLIVYWNGSEYKCKVRAEIKSGYEYLEIGRPVDIAASAADYDYPFTFTFTIIAENSFRCKNKAYDGGIDGKIYCSVKRVTEQIQKIDNKYINADWMATVKRECIQSQAEVSLSVCTSIDAWGVEGSYYANPSIDEMPELWHFFGRFNDNKSALYNAMLCIVWDGVPYYVKPQVGDVGLYVDYAIWGDKALVNGYSTDGLSAVDAECPFAFAYLESSMMILSKTEGTHTIEVHFVEVDSIPEHFMPECVVDKVILRSTKLGSLKKIQLSADDSNVYLTDLDTKVSKTCATQAYVDSHADWVARDRSTWTNLKYDNSLTFDDSGVASASGTSALTPDAEYTVRIGNITYTATFTGNMLNNYKLTNPDDSTCFVTAGSLDRKITKVTCPSMAGQTVTVKVGTLNRELTILPEKHLSTTVPVIQSASVGQTIRVKEVDTSGKPTAWEAVDFPTGGVSSWNDLTDKPFYSEIAEILPETTVEIDPEMGMGVIPDMAIYADDECTIKYNGTEYVCKCADMGEGVLALGNYGALDEENPVDTGEPFVLAKADAGDGTFVWGIVPLDGSASVTLSVIGQVHHPVPDKYLPVTGCDLIFTLEQNLDTGETYVSDANMDARTAWLRASSPNTIIRAISNANYPVLNLFAVDNEVAIFTAVDFESEHFYVKDVDGTTRWVNAIDIRRYTLKAFANGEYSFNIEYGSNNLAYLL